MMNVSELLTSIKEDLGILSIALPFEDENKELFDTIKRRTIKTFSQFFPHIMSIQLSLKDMVNIKSNYQETIYEIPDIFGDRRLLYVRKVTPRNNILGSNLISPIEDSIDIYDTIMSVQASANLMSYVVPSMTFKFQPPNLLYLYNMPTLATDVTIEFALEHTENLVTIPNTAWESFYELALLDIKKKLYPILRHYDQIQTAYGTINLHIDDWANAESERKELLEKWRDVYHLDTDQFIII